MNGLREYLKNFSLPEQKTVFLRVAVLGSLFLFVPFAYGKKGESASSKAEPADEINEQTKSFFNAVQGRRLKRFSALLKEIKNIDVRDKYGRTALYLAVDLNDFEMVKYLLKKGANVNIESSSLNTPLHIAKNKEMAELLFEYGAKVDSQDKVWTPLHSASWSNRLDVAKFLLDKGAKVNAKSFYGWTPLLMAKSKAMAELLLGYGANIHERNDRGETALHIVSYEGKNLELAEFYLEKALEINAEDENGRTPLYYAGTEEMEDFLLKRGASGESFQVKRTIKRVVNSCARLFESPKSF